METKLKEFLKTRRITSPSAYEGRYGVNLGYSNVKVYVYGKGFPIIQTGDKFLLDGRLYDDKETAELELFKTLTDGNSI